MTIDEEVNKEDLTELERKDVVSGVYQSIKNYNSDIKKLIQEKSKLLNFLNEAEMYESLGFKVKYFINKKANNYTFSYEEKGSVGFKK